MHIKSILDARFDYGPIISWPWVDNIQASQKARAYPGVMLRKDIQASQKARAYPGMKLRKDIIYVLLLLLLLV